MGCLATISWYLFETLLVLGTHALLTIIAKVGLGRLITLGIIAAIFWWIASAVLG